MASCCAIGRREQRRRFARRRRCFSALLLLAGGLPASDRPNEEARELFERLLACETISACSRKNTIRERGECWEIFRRRSRTWRCVNTARILSNGEPMLIRALHEALDQLFVGRDTDQLFLRVHDRGEAEPRRAQSPDDSVGGFAFRRRDDAPGVVARAKSAELYRTRCRARSRARSLRLPAKRPGNRSAPVELLSSKRLARSSVSGFRVTHCASGTITSRTRHVAEVDHVVDHRALGRSEGTFALALHRDLFQFLARGEEARAVRTRAREEETLPTRFPISSIGHKSERGDFENPAERRERAQGKAPEERFRQHAEDEEVNRDRGQIADEIAGAAECSRRARASPGGARRCWRRW